MGGLVQGKIADVLYARGVLSLLNVRRLFTTICLCTPAVTLVLLSWPGCNSAYAVSMICVGFFFNGAISPGFFSSFMDIAPNFAGTTFGISNTLGGALFGTTVPLFVGAIIEEKIRIIIYLLEKNEFRFKKNVEVSFLELSG